MKSTALSFAWENAKTAHQKVLIHIKWMYKYMSYFLNAGAYDHEEEVLLYDGAKLIVEQIEEVKNNEGKL